MSGLSVIVPAGKVNSAFPSNKLHVTPAGSIRRRESALSVRRSANFDTLKL
jgi:hypothetical protein